MTKKAVPTQATFSIRGLRTAEEELKLKRLLEGCTGVLRAEVRFTSQCIKIEFDEEIVPVQAATRLVTARMPTDREVPLVASIFLKIPSIRNEAQARLAVHVLQKVRGVERVRPLPDRQAVEVRLTHDGDLTTQDLIRTLAVEGIVANVI